MKKGCAGNSVNELGSGRLMVGACENREKEGWCRGGAFERMEVSLVRK